MQKLTKTKNPTTMGNDELFDPKENTQKATKTNQKSTKKIHALDVYIIFCFTSIIIYTVVHTMIFYRTGVEATVLDALFYGVFGGEVLLCALLKRLKLKHEFQLKLDQQKQQEENIELSEDRYEE